MRRIPKAAKNPLSLILLLAVAVGVVLAVRAYRQHIIAQAIAIHTPNGIDEAMYVKIG